MRPLTPNFTPFEPSLIEQIRALREKEIFQAAPPAPRKVSLGGTRQKKPRGSVVPLAAIAHLPPEVQAQILATAAGKA